MLARAATFALLGIDAVEVMVEADIHPGLPAFTIVGLPDTAVQESRERVRAALVNSGFEFPLRRVTVNLAPADLRKAGPGFDLALAAAVMAASGQIDGGALERYALCGELGLDGSVRPVRGVLAAADATLPAGYEGLILPRANAGEALLIPSLEVVGIESVRELAAFLAEGQRPEPVAVDAAGVLTAHSQPDEDLEQVRGHYGLKRALEVAAAGGHNVLMIGPPGSGKSMVARRMPSIMPPMALDEALEVTRIHSVAGTLGPAPLAARRPFRAPHHTISSAGLVGGGSQPAPGEASLAHNGVLFLDEVGEFQRQALDALRQPLEQGDVVLTRSQRTVNFPARFLLLAATNPCPCGHAGDMRRQCVCPPGAIARYETRLSSPLLDRIDLILRVDPPTRDELMVTGPTQSSAEIAARVGAARERQKERLGDSTARCNADMTPRQVRALCRLEGDARTALYRAHGTIGLSVRGHDRALRVARTLADLDGCDRIDHRHIAQAVAYRAGR